MEVTHNPTSLLQSHPHHAAAALTSTLKNLWSPVQEMVWVQRIHGGLILSDRWTGPLALRYTMTSWPMTSVQGLLRPKASTGLDLNSPKSAGSLAPHLDMVYYLQTVVRCLAQATRSRPVVATWPWTLIRWLVIVAVMLQHPSVAALLTDILMTSESLFKVGIHHLIIHGIMIQLAGAFGHLSFQSTTKKWQLRSALRQQLHWDTNFMDWSLDKSEWQSAAPEISSHIMLKAWVPPCSSSLEQMLAF